MDGKRTEGQTKGAILPYFGGVSTSVFQWYSKWGTFAALLPSVTFRLAVVKCSPMHSTLAEIFGFRSFRPYHEEIVRVILDGRDVPSP